MPGAPRAEHAQQTSTSGPGTAVHPAATALAATATSTSSCVGNGYLGWHVRTTLLEGAVALGAVAGAAYVL